jgi:hypothetical protein
LYSQPSFAAAFGRRVHAVANAIATQSDLPIDRIRVDLVGQWFSEIKAPEVTEDDSIFRETLEDVAQRADSAVVQRAMFVLRACAGAVPFLIEFVQSAERPYIARAFACPFSIADESAIRKEYSKDFADLCRL